MGLHSQDLTPTAGWKGPPHELAQHSTALRVSGMRIWLLALATAQREPLAPGCMGKQQEVGKSNLQIGLYPQNSEEAKLKIQCEN